MIIADQLQNKSIISKRNKDRSIEEADILYSHLPDQLQRAVDLAKEKGASTWLTVLPVTEHGFSLHRSTFQDALALQYGWSPSKLPSKCICGKNFAVEHALSCARGAYNEIRDLTANLLIQRCATMCTLNQIYSPCCLTNCPVPLPTHRMAQGSICQPTECGVGGMRRPSST